MPSEGKINPDEVARLFEEHSDELIRFLTGVAGDAQLARDAAQIGFTKLVESGGPHKAESRKAWLFRVAYNEVLAVRRRQGVANRAKQNLVWLHEIESGPVDSSLVRQESIEAVQEALLDLPDEQRIIVRLRIYEELTFAEIADRLGIPLGTALTRMRSALSKLRKRLKDDTG